MCILSIRCGVWFHCCFNLQFPGDLWYWASLHVHIVICICSYRGVCSDTLAILFLSYVFLLLSFKSSLYILDVKGSESHSVLSDSLQPMDCTDCIVHEILQARILEWIASCSLLQEISPTQGSNPGLLHCRWIFYQLSHKGSPRILEWVAYPFSSGSSWPRNRTGVFCIAGRIFTSWATRESPNILDTCAIFHRCFANIFSQIWLFFPFY